METKAQFYVVHDALNAKHWNLYFILSWKLLQMSSTGLISMQTLTVAKQNPVSYYVHICKQWKYWTESDKKMTLAYDPTKIKLLEMHDANLLQWSPFD